MEDLVHFISLHAGDDVAKLLLNREKWPDIDVCLAADCILSRRKLKGKVTRWAENPRLLCPLPLSAEQCSSDETAAYKASLAARILSIIYANGDVPGNRGAADQDRVPEQCQGRIADLTGGLGIDSWYFSQRAETVLYCEMKPLLARMAVHNFQELGAGNIQVRNCAVAPAASLQAKLAPKEEGAVPFLSPSELLGDFRPDLVFMDPARRGEGGRKVFLLEDCTPDVLGLMEELWTCTDHILLKLSPMADISMVAERLGPACREIHVVSSGGECKELLVWLDKANATIGKGYELVVYDSGTVLSCGIGAEAQAQAAYAGADLLESAAGLYLFEPGKSLMKAGLFNFISDRFHLLKLGRSTHYYVADSASLQEVPGSLLEGLGKWMPVREILPMNKQNLKETASRYPHAELTARNLPLTTDELRKKMKLRSGDDAHIYALKTDAAGNLLFIC